jgi:hypothetical protein
MLKFNRSSHVSSTFLVYFRKPALVPDTQQLQICFVAPETLANWGILLKAVLRQANHSTREVLSTVVRRWVWSRNLVNEEAMTHWGGGGCCTKNKRKLKAVRLLLQICITTDSIVYDYQITCPILTWPTISKCISHGLGPINTLRTGSFKLFNRPFPGFLTILTL